MRADAEAKRHDVLVAAWELLASQGAQVSLRTVASQAGVGIGTLYRHFPTREDLLVGVMSLVCDEVIGVVERCGSTWDDPERTWSQFAHALAELRIGALVTQVLPYAHASREVIERSRPLRREVFARIGEVLDHARNAGLIGALPTGVFLVGLGALSRPMPALTERKVPGLLDWLVDVYLAGLRPGGVPERFEHDSGLGQPDPT